MSKTKAGSLFAVLLALVSAACGDGSGPSGRLVNPDQVVAQCSQSTIADATTIQTLAGTLTAADCRIRGEDGHLEGYRLPQSAFGEMSEVLIDLEAGFDAILVIAGPDGFVIDFVDDDIDGDVGREQYVLPFDLDVDEPEYFVAVYDFRADGGDYTLRVGPVPAP